MLIPLRLRRLARGGRIQLQLAGGTTPSAVDRLRG
jgi:hypothetical protein